MGRIAGQAVHKHPSLILFGAASLNQIQCWIVELGAENRGEEMWLIPESKWNAAFWWE